MSGQYNLLEEKWIPVLELSGEFRKVSALEALENAHQIRQLAPNNPMDRVGILRFLLALIYWSRGSPSEVEQVNPTEPFPKGAFDKLRENRDCFNLLGNGKRFYQDLTAKRPRSTSELFQEIPTGNNFWHFRHTTDDQGGFCGACTVLGLLRLPLYCVSGLPNLKSGINGTPPVYLIPLGKTLRQTLALNWTPHSNIGKPHWEDYSPPLPGDSPTLLLRQLIRLHIVYPLHGSNFQLFVAAFV
jgi:CRISPR type I-E-associated protein CasA/Cse1